MLWFMSGYTKCFFPMSSQEVFPYHCHLWLAHQGCKSTSGFLVLCDNVFCKKCYRNKIELNSLELNWIVLIVILLADFLKKLTSIIINADISVKMSVRNMSYIFLSLQAEKGICLSREMTLMEKHHQIESIIKWKSASKLKAFIQTTTVGKKHGQVIISLQL